MRFHVKPRCVPLYVAARRIGISETQFRELLPTLRANGFPMPDAVTGNYDLNAIDRYIELRNPDLFPYANSDAIAVRDLEETKLQQELILARIDGIAPTFGGGYWDCSPAENGTIPPDEVERRRREWKQRWGDREPT